MSNCSCFNSAMQLGGQISYNLERQNSWEYNSNVYFPLKIPNVFIKQYQFGSLNIASNTFLLRVSRSLTASLFVEEELWSNIERPELIFFNDVY